MQTARSPANGCAARIEAPRAPKRGPEHSSKPPTGIDLASQPALTSAQAATQSGPPLTRRLRGSARPSLNRSSPRKRGPSLSEPEYRAATSIRTTLLRQFVAIHIMQLFIDFVLGRAYIPPSLAHRGAFLEAS